MIIYLLSYSISSKINTTEKYVLGHEFYVGVHFMNERSEVNLIIKIFTFLDLISKIFKLI